MHSIYGLIGHPLSHSFSKEYFSRFFEKEGIDAEYKNFDLDTIETLNAMLSKKPTLAGFNVTIPYKQQVIPYLHELDETAQAIGAVNVVKVTHKNDNSMSLKGYNTDVIGFKESIQPLLKPHHTHALILGTGGASKAVDYGLRQLGLNTQLVSRTSREGMLGYDELTPVIMEQHTVIVNTTPLGMHPKIDECPPLNYSLIGQQNLLFDVIYNPETTLFLQRGKQAGATVCNGMDMLIGQAKAAWRIWNE